MMLEKKTTTYEVNGQKYTSLDEVPPEYQKFFEDPDGNGIPDFIDQLVDGDDSTLSLSLETKSVYGKTAYKIGDQEFATLEELPVGYRDLIAQLGLEQSFGDAAATSDSILYGSQEMANRADVPLAVLPSVSEQAQASKRNVWKLALFLAGFLLLAFLLQLIF